MFYIRIALPSDCSGFAKVQVDRSRAHFGGIATLPKEVQSTIASARKLEKVVEL
jgi:hypothetical protein